MYDNAHFTKSKAIRNENAQLDCWKKFKGNGHFVSRPKKSTGLSKVEVYDEVSLCGCM